MNRDNKTLDIAICALKGCGKEFTPKPRQKYCSLECRLDAQNEKRHEWAEIHKEHKKEYNRERYVKTVILNEHNSTDSHLSEKLKHAAETGTTYAELQKVETLRIYGRVKI